MINLRVDLALADATRDHLGELRAEVQDGDGLWHERRGKKESRTRAAAGASKIGCCLGVDAELDISRFEPGACTTSSSRNRIGLCRRTAVVFGGGFSGRSCARTCAAAA